MDEKRIFEGKIGQKNILLFEMEIHLNTKILEAMQCNQTNQWSSTLNYMPSLLFYDEDPLESSQLKIFSTLLAISNLTSFHIYMYT